MNLGVAHAQSSGGSDWPGFLGPLGTSVSPEKGIVAPWPKSGPRVLWHLPIGTGYGAPSISKGRLYFFDRKGDQATLTCMKADSGESLWNFAYPTDYRDKYNYNNGPRCCPVIDGDLVFIHGAEGMLHCLRADTGKVVWKIDTRTQFGIVQNHFGVGSTPVVEGDLLIANIGGSPPGGDQVEDFTQLKGNGSGVVAFEKTTGKVRYKFSDELASYASPVLATVNGRRWCFMLARGGLIGFDPATGKEDFHFPWRAKDLESVNASNPVVVGGQVLISETYGPGGLLMKVKPGGYQVLWTDVAKFKKSLQCHWMTPIHHDGYVYASSGRHEYNADLRCVELATGKVTWRESGLTRTSLLMVDGHFVCLGEDGILRLLKVNPKRYEEISAVELVDPRTDAALLKFPCWAAPVLSHGLMYLRGDDRLVCVELIPRK